jgi:phospholipid/cholesterol/gamma-HCH transport system substrate-binding protein
MSQSRMLEVIVGLFVILGVMAVFFLSMRVSNLAGRGDTGAGYMVHAQFDNIGGLKVGAPVTLAGVRIGRVTDIRIDPKNFEADVAMNIARSYGNLPDDSDASILTAGLLGEQYVGVSPGGSEQVLKEGSMIKFTQSALVLENIIGQFLVNKAQESAAPPPSGLPPPPGAATPAPMTPPPPAGTQ